MQFFFYLNPMERGCVYTFSCIDLSIRIPLGSFFPFSFFFLPLLNFHLPQLWFNLGLFSYIRRCGLVFFRLLGRVSEMWFAPLIIFWRLVYRLSRTTPTFPNCIFSPSFCLNNNKEFNLANVLFWGFQFCFFFLFPFVVLSSSTCFFFPHLFPPSAFLFQWASLFFLLLLLLLPFCMDFVGRLAYRKRQVLCIREEEGNKARHQEL